MPHGDRYARKKAENKTFKAVFETFFEEIQFQKDPDRP
jgi:hypothetical protein